MRKRTVRAGLRSMAAGMVCILIATFLHDDISRLLSLELATDARITFLGFFLGGLLDGFGVLTAVVGLVQSGYNEGRVRLAPTVYLLFSLIVLFFVLAYASVTVHRPPHAPPRGESITI